MSAEILRRAASLMRERVETATEGPWFRGVGSDGSPTVHSEALLASGAEYTDVTAVACDGGDAEHIASWHPAVALAVADWLDTESVEWPENPDALAVARAYLGEVV